MKSAIYYSCASHIGHIRRVNQDNLLCGGRFLDEERGLAPPASGSVSAADRPVFAVFDGMGGGEHGEIASLIAARTAAAMAPGRDPQAALLAYCQAANSAICARTREMCLSYMGTTAAMLVFTGRGAVLCNIGDSKIFLLSGGQLKQLSQDHLDLCPAGQKPPLAQYLGIPPDELLLEPYTAQVRCRSGDTLLLCTDGLTDMLATEDIRRLADSTPIEELAPTLVEAALTRGGRDNVTVVACQVQHTGTWPFIKMLKDR